MTTTDIHMGSENADDNPLPSVPAESAGDHGRLEELAIPALLFAIGGYLVFGLATMEIPKTAKWPGPEFFPLIITVTIFVVSAAMTLQILRAHHRARRHHSGSGTPRTDWKATAAVAGAFIVFAFLLVPLGWILAGALLFWGVARGLGSHRPLFDLGVALGISSLIQLAFSAGLGLRLPPGIFGWF
jgi:putative tricarboxylic transport membrane protein